MIELTKKRETNSFLIKYKIKAIIKFKITTNGTSIKIPIETLGSGFICLTHNQIIAKSMIVSKIILIQNFIQCLVRLFSLRSLSLTANVSGIGDGGQTEAETFN